ncbi:MAG: type II CAAX endopeptidase family protein [Dermatophilus congolensis]|nr:type II CAAX endopeptidase family protein [Dermatophilus congolensis]
MTNRLATRLTTWKAWYAIPAFFAIVLASSVAVLGSFIPAEDAATRELINALLVPAQFIVIALLAVGFLAIVARRWPTTRDLGLRTKITGREMGLLAIVFVVSHVLFWLLSKTAAADPGQARRYFLEMDLAGPVAVAAASIVASAILAPVCEELLYRGAILRPIHDHLARHGRAGLGVVAGILASAAAFAMPHLGGSLTGAEAGSYLITGIAFGLVYVITGSMTAAMVSHSLQSFFVYAQILIFGRGDDYVSPIIWIIALGCPLWTYLCARALHAVFPKGNDTRDAVGEAAYASN